MSNFVRRTHHNHCLCSHLSKMSDPGRTLFFPFLPHVSVFKFMALLIKLFHIFQVCCCRQLKAMTLEDVSKQPFFLLHNGKPVLVSSGTLNQQGITHTLSSHSLHTGLSLKQITIDKQKAKTCPQLYDFIAIQGATASKREQQRQVERQTWVWHNTSVWNPPIRERISSCDLSWWQLILWARYSVTGEHPWPSWAATAQISKICQSSFHSRAYVKMKPVQASLPSPGSTCLLVCHI